jgi:hypothetical protein
MMGKVDCPAFGGEKVGLTPPGTTANVTKVTPVMAAATRVLTIAIVRTSEATH